MLFPWPDSNLATLFYVLLMLTACSCVPFTHQMTFSFLWKQMVWLKRPQIASTWGCLGRKVVFIAPVNRYCLALNRKQGNLSIYYIRLLSPYGPEKVITEENHLTCGPSGSSGVKLDQAVNTVSASHLVLIVNRNVTIKTLLSFSFCSFFKITLPTNE